MPIGACLVGTAILLVGAALRIRGASGELWLDKIWSLKLVRQIQDEHDLLRGIAIDNNHYLNSVYLYLVGTDAPAIALRSLSIALGVLTIGAAGWSMRRSGPAGVLAAMALFAISYPMVNYGSEARGYSGIIFMTILAIPLVEDARDRRQRAAPLALGLVALTGFLFQPVMLLGLAILGLWVTWTSWRSTRSFSGTKAMVFHTFLPSAALLVPAIGLLVFAISETGAYQVGDTKPFSVASFLTGYGGMLRYELSLPESVPNGLAMLAAPATIGLAVMARHRLTGGRVPLAVVALIIAPIVIFCLQPPNVGYPRYYLSSGVVLLLLLADLFAAAWRRGGLARLVGLAVALLYLLGAGAMLDKFFAYGRGDITAALRVIASDRDRQVTSNGSKGDEAVVEYFAARLRIPVRYVPMDEFCRQRPQWFLTRQDKDRPAEGVLTLPECTATVRLQAEYPAWGLSGLSWSLYRVGPGEEAR